MYSTDSTTQTSLELTTQNRRIHRYILSALRQVEKNVEEYYINKYNPFYKWHIGSLREDEIIKALRLFFDEKETGEKIKNNVATSKAFSQLVASYKETVEAKEPKSLTNKEWLSVRKNYEDKLKQEYEQTLGTISHNENIDYSEHKYNKNDEDTREISTSKTINESDKDEADETIMMNDLENEVEYLLDDIHQDKWKVKVLLSDKEGFEYQMAIIKLHVEDEILKIAISLLQKRYADALFTLRNINSQSYIEGFMNVK